jgi:hypothetical protein
MLIGAAQITHDSQQKYLVEAYFPHGQKQRRYIWEFVPATNELLLRLTSNELPNDQFDLPLEPSSELVGYFCAQVRNLTAAHVAFDYERDWSANRYEFVLPQFQT